MAAKTEPLFAVLSEFDQVRAPLYFDLVFLTKNLQATKQWLRFITVTSASPGVSLFGIAVGNAGKMAVLDHNSISVM